MNMLGVMMQKEKLKWSGDVRINTKMLPASIYLLQMKTKSEGITTKFVKE